MNDCERFNETTLPEKEEFYKVIISCSTCCPLDRVRVTWVGASFDYNKVIISCTTCCNTLLKSKLAPTHVALTRFKGQQVPQLMMTLL